MSQDKSSAFSQEDITLFQNSFALLIHQLVKGVDIALSNEDWTTVKVYSVLLMKKYNALYESSIVKQAEKAKKKASIIVPSTIVDVEKTLRGPRVYYYDGALDPGSLAFVLNEAHQRSSSGLAMQVGLGTFATLITEQWFLRDFEAETSVEAASQGSPGKYLGVPIIYLTGQYKFLPEGLHFYALETK